MGTKEDVAAVNERLRAGRVRVRLKVRGDRINLRATLPPKPDSARKRPYQQVISTGLPVTTQGIRQATAKAKMLAGELDSERFSWENWHRGFKPRCLMTVEEAIAAFEKHYRSTHEIKERSWKASWLRSFKCLPRGVKVNEDMLRKAIRAKPENTQVRLTMAYHMQAFADFCGLDVNLLIYKGNYGPGKVKDRKLPTDKEIVENYNRIKDPGWRWVYGIIAAAGLRPHEAFFCEWSEEGLEVTQGKTGPRTIRQLFHPEWIKQFDLKNIRRPSIKYQAAYESGKLGNIISTRLKAKGVTTDIYAIRHAQAVRMALYGLPVAVAAKFMGHSPDVHLKRYHKHIGRSVEEAAVQIALSSRDRPLPP